MKRLETLAMQASLGLALLTAGQAFALKGTTNDRVEQGIEECWTLDRSTKVVKEYPCGNIPSEADLVFTTHFNNDFADGGCLVVHSELAPNDKGPYAETLTGKTLSYTYYDRIENYVSCLEEYYGSYKSSVAGMYR